jgi:hypothetical protein
LSDFLGASSFSHHHHYEDEQPPLVCAHEMRKRFSVTTPDVADDVLV